MSSSTEPATTIGLEPYRTQYAHAPAIIGGSFAVISGVILGKILPSPVGELILVGACLGLLAWVFLRPKTKPPSLEIDSGGLWVRLPSGARARPVAFGKGRFEWRTQSGRGKGPCMRIELPAGSSLVVGCAGTLDGWSGDAETTDRPTHLVDRIQWRRLVAAAELDRFLAPGDSAFDAPATF